MVDFSKFGRKGKDEVSTNPLEIFFKLPKSDVNDLYQSQSAVLSQWFDRKDIKDTIIKLHTGGGKTLVGLLIAKSIMNETKGPVIYLVPNKQLMIQVHALSKQYGIDSEVYEDKFNFTDAYYRGALVLIATYAALFNGRSNFGILGGPKELQSLKGVIIDDAHIAPSLIRQQFTLEIPKDSSNFNLIRNLFKSDFEQIGKIGVFEDMAIGRDSSILEAPYWAIKNKSHEIRNILQNATDIEGYTFIWPLLRDNLENCHILITSNEVVITPIGLDMDLFPSFANCPRRIFMSATIRDHGDIIRAFDLRENNLNILKAKSVAGIGEKMIIAPELVLGGDSKGFIKKISKSLGVKPGAISVIVPSAKYANDRWSDFGNVVMGNDVNQAIKNLLSLKAKEPTVFVNRYDGMDLKGEACRILILDGLPSEIGVYDRYRAAAISGGESKATILASRIEQGIGRSSRGSGDYSIVFLVGSGLTNWINLTKNTDLLTVSTRSQVNMGNEITKSFTSENEILDFAKQCLERDKKWIEYHNSELVEAIENEENYNDIISEELAFREEKYYNFIKRGDYRKAYSFFKNDPDNKDKMTKLMLGWYKQLAARAAFYAGDTDESKDLQEQAYNLNRGLLRPSVLTSYVPLVSPSSQCFALKEYTISLRNLKGLLTQYNVTVAELDMRTQTPHQFEETFRRFGEYFGFTTSRPENETGEGPDVLWLTPGKQAFIIEVKSDKHIGSAFNKEDNGQILNSIIWFEKHYKGFDFLPIAVMPNNMVTHGAQPHPEFRIMSAAKLASMKSAGEEFITKISNQSFDLKNESECSKEIENSHLNFVGIKTWFTERPNVET